jgi:hypothetical protein
MHLFNERVVIVVSQSNSYLVLINPARSPSPKPPLTGIPSV